VLLGGEDDGARHGDAYASCQRIAEELVIGTPPEGVVDHARAAECGNLEHGAVEGDVVRNPVQDDIVAQQLIHAHAANFDKLGCHVGQIHAVDGFDERGREALFHAEENADDAHWVAPVVDLRC
jgi:hypothetical protein